MSCQIDSDDSSDYGSEFTPDEEAILNDLLIKAGHATEQADATSPSTPISISTPTPIEQFTTPKSPELIELESLQPAALAAHVADIEDGVEEPSVRLPKVLGREGPRSPWRSQPRPGQRARWNPEGMGQSITRASNSNRSSPSGMLISILHFVHVFCLRLSFTDAFHPLYLQLN
jgi:exonuclease V